MVRVSSGIALACGVFAAVIAAGAATQGQQLYRYVDKDGRIVYSDRQPPGDAKDVQAKRLGANVIESNDLPIAAQRAQERFPVTLFTFGCGEVCQSAEGLLNRRGVPFVTVNVEDPKGAEQLKKLTGELQAPVLQVGDKLVAKGYNEAKWNAMLDDVGYPKAAPRRTVPARAPAETAAAKSDAPQAAPAPASGYPKQ